MDRPLKSFVITLARAKNRRSQVQRLVENISGECEVLEGVDGRELSQEEMDSVYVRRLHLPSYPAQLRPGEIGCFLSHRKVWQRILDDQVPYAFVLEDDADLRMPEFADSLQFAIDSASDGDYVQFQVRNLEKIPYREIAVSEREPRLRLVQPVVVPLRGTAQLITQGAAARLLAATRIFDRPVDTMMQMHWITKVRMLMMLPSNVREVSAELGGTTIGHTSREWTLARLRRELMRPIYRYRIAKLSHQYRSG